MPKQRFIILGSGNGVTVIGWGGSNVFRVIRLLNGLELEFFLIFGLFRLVL